MILNWMSYSIAALWVGNIKRLDILLAVCVRVDVPLNWTVPEAFFRGVFAGPSIAFLTSITLL